MAEEHVLTADEVVQSLRAIRHVTPTGEQEYVCADRIARSHEMLRTDIVRLRLHLEAIVLGVANGNRGFDVAWAELAEAALAGREPHGATAVRWLTAARYARESGGG